MKEYKLQIRDLNPRESKLLQKIVKLKHYKTPELEYIICSAIYYDDGIERVHLPKNIKTGLVACGLRHSNCFVVLHKAFPGKRVLVNQAMQGFLTSHNRFVTRKIAAKIAYKSGQIKNKIKELSSEDLY